MAASEISLVRLRTEQIIFLFETRQSTDIFRDEALNKMQIATSRGWNYGRFTRAIYQRNAI